MDTRAVGRTLDGAHPAGGARTIHWRLARPLTRLAVWSVAMVLGTFLAILITHLALTVPAILTLSVLGMVTIAATYLALAVTVDRVEVEIGDAVVRVGPRPLPLPLFFPPRELRLAELLEVRAHGEDVVIVVSRASRYALPEVSTPDLARALLAELSRDLRAGPVELPASRARLEVLLRALGGLAISALGLWLMLLGNGDFRHALLDEGNGPLLPLWFVGPFLIVLGLGLVSASGSRERIVERALAHAMAWFGLAATILGALMIASVWFICMGAFFAPLGLYVLVRAAGRIGALAAADR